MESRGRRVYLIFPVLVMLAVGVAYFFGWDIGAKLHPDITAYSLPELAEMVNEQIDEGASGGNFYVLGVTKEEIDNINQSLCGINGVVSRYSVIENGYRGMKLMLEYDISDNYYVYHKYKDGYGIPGDRAAAIKLYDKVVEILDMIIEEDMTDYEKELAIHDYIVCNCKYGYTDYSKEYAYRAYGALVQKTAVCNGYAEAMALLLDCVGIENEIVTGTADGELHAWNRVCLDGKWYQVDATWDDPIPDRGYNAAHIFFNVTDDIMGVSHEWNKEDYVACDSVAYNYFHKSNLVCDINSFKNEVKRVAQGNVNGVIEALVTDYDEELYNMEFVSEIPGILYIQYTVQAFGDNQIVTVYLNERD